MSARSSRKRKAGKGSRDVVRDVPDLGATTAKAAQTARQTREAYEPEAPQYPPVAEEAAAPAHRLEPHLEPEDLNSVEYDTRQRDPEPAYEPEDEQPPVPAPPTRSTRRAARQRQRNRNMKENVPPDPDGGLARLVVVLIILAGVVATVSWQWSAIAGLYEYLAHLGSKSQTQANHEMPSEQPKFSGRVPQDQSAGQAPGAAAPAAQTAPAVGQRVVLYEEDPSDPQGKRYIGSAIWRTETARPARDCP